MQAPLPRLLERPELRDQPGLQPSIMLLKQEAWRQLTFRNIPRNTSKEHFAGVDRVLVVPGRKLAAPGTGSFIHSFGGRDRETGQRTTALPWGEGVQEEQDARRSQAAERTPLAIPKGGKTYTSPRHQPNPVSPALITNSVSTKTERCVGKNAHNASCFQARNW